MVALIRHEAGYERIRNAIADTIEPVRIAGPGYVEAAIVIDAKRDPKASRTLDSLITDFEIEIVPFTADHARIAREAYRDYGKGSGHPAKLNFGDCMAYALARCVREPLLFVGNDFSHTDIEPAIT